MTDPCWTPFLRVGETCWRLGRSRRMAVLIDAARYFDVLTQAVQLARRSVYVASWDIDTRIEMRRVEGINGVQLRALFEQALTARPELHIHVLNWDHAMLYALEREALPSLKLGWRGHERLHFELDSAHPPGASHHQKLVVIDDAVAFVGGVDLTRRRWDTPEHVPDDRRRRDHAGRAYLPFHDVQAMVDGAPAAAVGELFRTRWRIATGERLARPTDVETDPWPATIRPHVRNATVGVARTRAAHAGLAAVREVEALHLAAIAAARHTLYFESPYFTSAAMCEALQARLLQAKGPEVVLVLPDRSDGWLEEHTMNRLRIHFLEQLRASDVHGRLAVYHPRIPGAGNVNVHAKLVVVDDQFIKIGSANLTNRSMSLDSECDLGLVAAGDERIARAIGEIRDRLLAEHLDQVPERVQAEYAKRGSLIEAVEALRGRGRSLVPVAPTPTAWVDTAVEHIHLIDPEQPIRAERFVAQLGLEQVERWSRWRILGLLAALGALAALTAAWHTTAVGRWFDLARLTGWAATVRATPLVWPAVPLGMALLCGLMFPVTPLWVATAAVFDPLPAILLSMAGSLAAATVNFAVGRWLGRDLVERLAGGRAKRLSLRLAHRGMLNVALVRLLPVAPFPRVNLVIGASGVRLRDYLIGTAIGMAPGIVLIVLMTDLARSLVLSPSPLRASLLTALISLLVAAIWVVRRRLDREKGDAPEVDEPAATPGSALTERGDG